jgi:hypothetical protein
MRIFGRTLAVLGILALIGLVTGAAYTAGLAASGGSGWRSLDTWWRATAARSRRAAGRARGPRSGSACRPATRRRGEPGAALHRLSVGPTRE